MAQPLTATAYLRLDELGTYAPTVSVAAFSAGSLIQRASAMINMRYDRTAEIVPIPLEVIELSDVNIGHLPMTPVQTVLVNGNWVLDASQGDTIEVRYSSSLYPYAAFTPPTWQSLDATTIDLNPTTGRLMVPVGIFPVPYSEARITYRAGFCPVGGPYPEWLKQGCGALIENIVQRGGTRQAQKIQIADQQGITLWDPSLFDQVVEGFLQPLSRPTFF